MSFNPSQYILSQTCQLTCIRPHCPLSILMASTKFSSSADSALGADPSIEVGIDHNASQCFTAPKVQSPQARRISQLEEKVLELEGKTKNLKGEIDTTNLNAAGLALNFDQIVKRSDLLFGVRMVRTLVSVHCSM